MKLDALLLVDSFSLSMWSYVEDARSAINLKKKVNDIDSIQLLIPFMTFEAKPFIEDVFKTDVQKKKIRK